MRYKVRCRASCAWTSNGFWYLPNQISNSFCHQVLVSLPCPIPPSGGLGSPGGLSRRGGRGWFGSGSEYRYSFAFSSSLSPNVRRFPVSASRVNGPNPRVGIGACGCFVSFACWLESTILFEGKCGGLSRGSRESGGVEVSRRHFPAENKRNWVPERESCLGNLLIVYVRRPKRLWERSSEWILRTFLRITIMALFEKFQFEPFSF